MSELRSGITEALTGEHFQRSQSNLLAAIDSEARLPKNVFRPGWGSFCLFDSDWMFEGAFVEKVRLLQGHEGASCACIINLDRDRCDAPYSFAIDERTSVQDYERRLAGVGPGDGWVYDIDRFGCTSDIGTWCIYCERASELAIIGFRGVALQERYHFLLAALHASRVSSVGASPIRFEFSSHSISREWQAEIVRNYDSA
jgi:hypothetical protein